MTRPQWKQDELQKTTWRLGELESLVECVTLLRDALQAAGPQLRSQALRDLRAQVNAIAGDPLFQEMRSELPDLLEQIRSLRAITIGVNLDDQLRPTEAALLAIHERPFRGDSLSFFERLGRVRNAPEGIGPLHRAEDGEGLGARLKPGDSPLLAPLFSDLNDVLNETCRPLATALRRYTRISGRALLLLQEEIAFYLGALRLIDHLRACGLPTCRPRLAPAEARLCELRGLVNLNLALQLAPPGKARALDDELVGNDADFGESGRIHVLTGPNRGGKTTWTQALGLAQVLLQAGLYLPARSARMSPVDGLFTHFAAAEQPLQASGRLGEEAQRLAAIFRRATRHSLLLFNESLAQHQRRRKLLAGARRAARVALAGRARPLRHAICTNWRPTSPPSTPKHPATARWSAWWRRLCRATTTIARTHLPHRAGAALGHSHAREIAAQYGISFEQLRAQFQARNGLTPEAERRAAPPGS